MIIGDYDKNKYSKEEIEPLVRKVGEIFPDEVIFFYPTPMKEIDALLANNLTKFKREQEIKELKHIQEEIEGVIRALEYDIKTVKLIIPMENEE